MTQKRPSTRLAGIRHYFPSYARWHSPPETWEQTCQRVYEYCAKMSGFCPESYGCLTHKDENGVWLSSFVCYCLARGERGCANDPVNLRHADPELQLYIEEQMSDALGG